MNFDDIMAELERRPDKKRLAVAAAEDGLVLDAVAEAARRGLVKPVLVGDADKIRAIASAGKGMPEGAEIVAAGSHEESARKAVALVASGEAQALMKGLLPTHILLRAVLNKEHGLQAGELLSHVGIVDAPELGRLLFITDGGMVMYPDLKQKAMIIENAAALARGLGVETPRVACVCAIETVNPAMPPTVDAAALAIMSQRGQIKGCIVDGPLGLDMAMSLEAAEHKGVLSPIGVAGRADILLVPNIETGNAVLKTIRHLAKQKVAGLIVGASAPIVVTSRMDTLDNKLYAIGCALRASGI